MAATASSVQAPPVRPGLSGGEATRRQIRGSSLLLGGRMLSLAVNFATQILIVRYLSKSDFGAFAYGLSIVSLGESLAVLGLDKAIARFLPIYEEHGAYGKLFGTLFMVLGTVLGVGLAFVLLAIGLNGFAGGDLGGSSQALTVILILICLSPIQALDDVLMGTFAVFSKPRAIFFRKYVLAPGLRLAAIVLVVLSQNGVTQLALGYVVAGGLGVALYMVMLAQTLRADGLLKRLDTGSLRFPVREVFGFALPLMTVDLLFVVMNTTNVWMLERFSNATDVADYRVVQPAARLNVLVMTSFTLLFTPLAARLFARDDKEAIRELYWRTAAWIAVFSFPVFALTFGSAHELTVALFGDRYASSGTILALLSLGYYFNAALGFNGLTLRVFGLVRYTVVISVGAAVANVGLNLLLIPAYGALGAGIGTCATLLLHNVLKQAGLRKGTGIGIFDREHLRVYGAIVVATVALVGLHALVAPGPIAAVGLVAATSAALLWFSRDCLRVGQTFPELLRVPLLRRLVS
ncbi:MAG TPA: flippase [Candidatus Dormibacteraeota bacterium]|nr:flippase [Candidatus Dormibacteraeota bacterium]